jgi:hypothetical protein
LRRYRCGTHGVLVGDLGLGDPGVEAEEPETEDGLGEDVEDGVGENLSVGGDHVGSLSEGPDDGVGGPESDGEEGDAHVGGSDGIRSGVGGLASSNDKAVELQRGHINMGRREGFGGRLTT